VTQTNDAQDKSEYGLKMARVLEQVAEDNSGLATQVVTAFFMRDEQIDISSIATRLAIQQFGSGQVVSLANR
jgi:hypothetical protein